MRRLDVDRGNVKQRVAIVTGVALVVSVAAALAFGGGGSSRGPAIVAVLVAHPAGAPDRATGFVTTGHRIVTVAHVFDGGRAVAVLGGGGAQRPARVLRMDRTDDLALLAADELPQLAEADAGGTRVLAAGNGSVTVLPAQVRRHVQADVRLGNGQTYRRPALELSGVRISSGDSGAPVVDGDGRLLGVVFARSAKQADVAYAVDASAVDRLVR
jgi:S1-C subfamily serine protease